MNLCKHLFLGTGTMVNQGRHLRNKLSGLCKCRPRTECFSKFCTLDVYLASFMTSPEFHFFRSGVAESTSKGGTARSHGKWMLEIIRNCQTTS
jgi:hypothetical protein